MCSPADRFQPPYMQFGLLGRHLGHSFSARYFATKFADENLPFSYTNFELTTQDALPTLLTEHPDLVGFNVTIPYKEAVLPYIKWLTPQAAAVGAVNTVYVGTEGMTGHNTDVEGFGCSLDELTAGKHLRKALILGTGGASKAVIAALEKRDVTHTCVTRSADSSWLSYASLSPEIVAQCDLIVNATPLGTWPDTESRPTIPYQAIAPGTFCFDLVYNPAETAFMRECRRQRAITTNGLRMLHLQADAAWRWWCACLTEEGRFPAIT